MLTDECCSQSVFIKGWQRGTEEKALLLMKTSEATANSPIWIPSHVKAHIINYSIYCVWELFPLAARTATTSRTSYSHFQNSSSVELNKCFYTDVLRVWNLICAQPTDFYICEFTVCKCRWTDLTFMFFQVHESHLCTTRSPRKGTFQQSVTHSLIIH